MKETQKWEGRTLSPTSILTFLKCKREFYYHYIKKIPTPPSIHLLKGSVIHKVLENFFNLGYKEPLEQTLFDLLDNDWTRNQKYLQSLKLSKEDEEKAYQDCKVMVDMYIRGFRIKMDGLKWSGKAESDSHAYYLLRPKFREAFYKDDDLNVCGYVDRIHKDFEGVTTLGDYKTSSRFGIGIKTEYEIQCGIYALLHKLKTGRVPDYTSIIYLRYGEEIRTRVVPEQIQASIDLIKDVHSKIKSPDITHYPKTQSNFCKWCNYFDKCSGIEEHKNQVRLEKFIKQVNENELEKQD